MNNKAHRLLGLSVFVASALQIAVPAAGAPRAVPDPIDQIVARCRLAQIDSDGDDMDILEHDCGALRADASRLVEAVSVIGELNAPRDAQEYRHVQHWFRLFVARHAPFAGAHGVAAASDPAIADVLQSRGRISNETLSAAKASVANHFATLL